MKKIIILGSLFLAQGLSALSFGSMGNTSAGLGDSGVALRKSAWGVYYNPALLAADNRGKFGYSFGATLEQKGIGQLSSAFFGGNTEGIDLNEIWNLYQASQEHSLGAISQSGIAIQITGGTYEEEKLDGEGKEIGEFVEKRNPYGAFTMGAFVSGYVSGEMNVTRTDSMSQSGEITLNAQGNAFGVALLEVPFGWGWRFDTENGDISIGASVKYMGMSGGAIQGNGSLSDANGVDFTYVLPTTFGISHNFGVDLGVLYSIYGLNFGLVAKNINAPSFDVSGKKIRVMPQFRLGVSYEFADYFALTFDSDLSANNVLFDSSKQTQMIGGGLLMDFKYIDLRLGVMGNMADQFNQGAIITGGINLLGFLDVALQASTEMFKVQKYSVPNLVTLKVGGSFTF